MKKIFFYTTSISLLVILIMLSGCSSSSSSAYLSSMAGNFQDYAGSSFTIEYIVNQNNIQAINQTINANLTRGEVNVVIGIQVPPYPYVFGNPYTQSQGTISGTSTLYSGSATLPYLQEGTGVQITFSPSNDAAGTFNVSLSGGPYIKP